MAPKNETKFAHLELSTAGPVDCALTGSALLNNPYLNRGSGFTSEERGKFALTGLVRRPSRHSTSR